MLNFKKIKWKNFLSTGNLFTEVQLDKNKTTLISGSNGHGKCLDPNTEIEIIIEDCSVMKKFKKYLK